MDSLEHRPHDHIDRVQHYRVGWPVLMFFVVLLFMVLGGITASYFIQVDIVQTFRGRIQDDAGRRVLRMPIDAKIERYLVELGEPVTKGQTIVELDTRDLELATDSIAQRMALTCDQWWFAHGQIQSIVQLAPWLASDKLGGVATPSCSLPTDVVRRQIQTFTAGLRLDLASRDADLNRLDHELVSLQTTLSIEREKQSLLAELLNQNRAMARRQLIPRRQVEQESEQLLAVQQSITDLTRRMTQIPIDHLDIQLSFDRQVTAQLESAMDTANTVARTLKELEAEQQQALHLLSRATSLVAPIDGYVSSLQESLVQSAISAGEELVVFTPTSGEKSVRLAITPSTIGFVEPGQRTAVRIDTFPYQRYGYVSGVTDRIILGLSASAEENTQGVSAIVVKIDNLDTLKVDPTLALRSGLTVEASVVTGKRRLISYFTDPVTDSLQKSMREN